MLTKAAHAPSVMKHTHTEPAEKHCPLADVAPTTTLCLETTLQAAIYTCREIAWRGLPCRPLSNLLVPAAVPGGRVRAVWMPRTCGECQCSA